MDTPPPLRRLMVALDGSEHAAKAFSRALALAQQVLAHAPDALLLHLLTVIEPGSWVEEGQQHSFLHGLTKAGAAAGDGRLDAALHDKARHLLAPFEERCRQVGVRYVSVVGEGMSAREEICRQVEQHQIDLLVLGTRGLATLPKLLMGSVAEYCTQHAASSVLVVR